MKKKTKFFYTYQQAKRAVKRLNITSQREYKRHYKKDKKLMAHPERAYKTAGWTCWHEFLGKKKPNFYPRYAQAKAAVKKLGVLTAANFKIAHKQDARLPSHPDEYYEGKGWKGWIDFLAKR